MSGKSWRIAFLWFLLCVAFLFMAINIVKSLSILNSDFFQFWLAGRMIWSNQNPYSPETWIQAHYHFGASWVPKPPIFPYPLPLATLLAPLGLLPIDQAYITWVYFSEVIILVCILLLVSIWEVPRAHFYLFALSAGIFLFRPTIVTLRNGQLGTLLLFILTVVILLWNNGRWFLGGLVMAFTFLKPTLGIPLIAMTGVWNLREKRLSAIAGNIVGYAAIMGIGWIQNPDWFTTFLKAGYRKLSDTFGYSPTIWGVSSFICNHDHTCTIGLGWVTLVLLLVSTLWWLYQSRIPISPIAILGIAIPLTVVITPYIWAYDQILLIIPIITLTMMMAERGYPYLFTAILPIGISILAIGLLFIAIQLGNDSWSMSVPLIILVLMLLSMRGEKYAAQI